MLMKNNMITELKRSHLYSKWKVEYLINWKINHKHWRLKSYNNSKKIAVFVFSMSDDWFELEWEEVYYSRIFEFIW